MTGLIDIQELTIRLAEADDQGALKRLAERDSSTVPAGPVLVAESDTDLIAAASMTDGRVIADPFRHSAGAADLLVERLRQIEASQTATMASTMTSAPRGRNVTPMAPRAGGSPSKHPA
jgi:hypothetical protein